MFLFVGELGWELHLESSRLVELHQQISRIGENFGLADFGSYALNAMRIEKAYHGWGADFGSEYTMFDAGLEKFIDFEKRDFIGRNAVLNQRGRHAQWRFVKLKIEALDAVPLPSDPIMQGENCGRLHHLSNNRVSC